VIGKNLCPPCLKAIDNRIASFNSEHNAEQPATKPPEMMIAGMPCSEVRRHKQPSRREQLWTHMSTGHGLTLLESELDDIINLAAQVPVPIVHWCKTCEVPLIDPFAENIQHCHTCGAVTELIPVVEVLTYLRGTIARLLHTISGQKAALKASVPIHPLIKSDATLDRAVGDICALAKQIPVTLWLGTHSVLRISSGEKCSYGLSFVETVAAFKRNIESSGILVITKQRTDGPREPMEFVPGPPSDADVNAAIHKDLKNLLDDRVKQLIQKHNIQSEALTDAQLATVIKQALECGDIIRNVRIGDRTQSVTYLPYAMEQKLTHRVVELTNALKRLVEFIPDHRHEKPNEWRDHACRFCMSGDTGNDFVCALHAAQLLLDQNLKHETHEH
jgi:hypothetical protein